MGERDPSDDVGGSHLDAAIRSTRADGSASRLAIHCELPRTVDTSTASPIRIDISGTERGLPLERPVVSTSTGPTPIGI